MTEAEPAGLWCARCGKRVRLAGGEGLPAQLRKAVHAATGLEAGDNGHLAAPADSEPPLWKSARILAAEFGGAFDIGAWFGFLRADWANLPAGAIAGHFEADDEEGLRLKLKAAAGARPPQAGGDAGAGR